MHPSQTDLKKFVDESLGRDARDEIGRHVEACDLCREYVSDYRQFREAVSGAAAEPLPDAARVLADRAYDRALQGRVIALEPLLEERKPRRMLLAADGTREPGPAVRALATHYSEVPEIVLRVMRDEGADRNYLQLISDDPGLAADAMVQIPELNREFVTDAAGRAELADLSAKQLASAQWQVRMPDAVFDLEPMEYDPDRTEYTREVMLETDRDDRIRVVFEGKTEGKQVSVEVLALEGKTEFDSCVVTVSQQEQTSILDARPGQAVRYRLGDSESKVKIRLFG